MRFIHMADVHLGAVPDSGCPWSAFRENEIWETFVRVIDQIREEKIELLLIAGDLFHRQPLPSQTERVSQLFASIPDTEVVWMAGSHDYLREDSAYRKVKWTKNVHGFLSEKPEVISLEKLHTKVYGCSYEHPEVTEAIYSSIRLEDQPGIHILLAYGGDETHIPMKKEDGAGFDYVALGYRHIPGVLVQNQMAYAGSPEPIRLEETGTHGVVYGEITEDEQGQYHTQITLVPCACRSYIPLSLRIHSGTTQAALEQKVQDAIAQKGSEDIYWLRIQGYRNPELEFELEALRAYGNIVKITDETRPCYDLNRLKREKLGTKTGAYIHWFEKKQGKVEQKALDYGLQALLAEDRDEREVLSEKITAWKEKKQELQKERESRSAVVEQTMHRIMRERSGLEQQLLVNGSEIRRLELNRSELNPPGCSIYVFTYIFCCKQENIGNSVQQSSPTGNPVIIRFGYCHHAKNTAHTDHRLLPEESHIRAIFNFRCISAGTVKHHQTETGQQNHTGQQIIVVISLSAPAFFSRKNGIPKLAQSFLFLFRCF